MAQNSDNNFQATVREILKGNPSLAHVLPAVEKEVLHYEMLSVLEKEGLLKNLTFQGGTCLRLCYGGLRLSEDLDFTGGINFDKGSMDRIGDVILERIGKKYGLSVSVKTPKETRNQNGVNVSKWQISVVTSEKRSVPRQRIKLEVANIPSETSVIRPLSVNYEQVSGDMSILLKCQSASEIFSDKLVALPACTSHIRYRDVWDIVFLTQRGVSPDYEHVKRKLGIYGVTDYAELVSERVKSLSDPLFLVNFVSEMRRFVPEAAQSNTLNNDDFLRYATEEVSEQLKKSAASLGEEKRFSFFD